MSTGYLYFTGVLFKPSNEHPGILFYVGVLPGLPRVLKTDGSWLTLYCSRVTYRFYSVQCQTILLCPMPDDFTRHRETSWAEKGYSVHILWENVWRNWGYVYVISLVEILKIYNVKCQNRFYSKYMINTM